MMPVRQIPSVNNICLGKTMRNCKQAAERHEVENPSSERMTTEKFEKGNEEAKEEIRRTFKTAHGEKKSSRCTR